ncbi:MAG: hypothetical protein WA665_21245, partial [Pseudolabrys sp.]
RILVLLAIWCLGDTALIGRLIPSGRAIAGTVFGRRVVISRRRQKSLRRSGSRRRESGEQIVDVSLYVLLGLEQK